MTLLVKQILEIVQELRSDIKYLKREKKKEESKKTYLTPEEVKEKFGFSKDALRYMRRKKTITDWECKKTNRDFRYSEEELENVRLKSR